MMQSIISYLYIFWWTNCVYFTDDCGIEFFLGEGFERNISKTLEENDELASPRQDSKSEIKSGNDGDFGTSTALAITDVDEEKQENAQGRKILLFTSFFLIRTLIKLYGE